MKKHEKLRKEADALKSYADTIEENNELHMETLARTELATRQLLDSKVTSESIETYRAMIHRINLDIQAINRSDELARAKLKAEMMAIEADFFETNE